MEKAVKAQSRLDARWEWEDDLGAESVLRSSSQLGGQLLGGSPQLLGGSPCCLGVSPQLWGGPQLRRGKWRMRDGAAAIRGRMWLDEGDEQDARLASGPDGSLALDAGKPGGSGRWCGCRTWVPCTGPNGPKLEALSSRIRRVRSLPLRRLSWSLMLTWMPAGAIRALVTWQSRVVSDAVQKKWEVGQILQQMKPLSLGASTGEGGDGGRMCTWWKSTPGQGGDQQVWERGGLEEELEEGAMGEGLPGGSEELGGAGGAEGEDWEGMEAEGGLGGRGEGEPEAAGGWGEREVKGRPVEERAGGPIPPRTLFPENTQHMDEAEHGAENQDGAAQYAEGGAEQYVEDGAYIESLGEYGGEGGWEEDAERYVEEGAERYGEDGAYLDSLGEQGGACRGGYLNYTWKVGCMLRAWAEQGGRGRGGC